MSSLGGVASFDPLSVGCCSRGTFAASSCDLRARCTSLSGEGSSCPVSFTGGAQARLRTAEGGCSFKAPNRIQAAWRHRGCEGVSFRHCNQLPLRFSLASTGSGSFGRSFLCRSSLDSESLHSSSSSGEKELQRDPRAASDTQGSSFSSGPASTTSSQQQISSSSHDRAASVSSQAQTSASQQSITPGGQQGSDSSGPSTRDDGDETGSEEEAETPLAVSLLLAPIRAIQRTKAFRIMANWPAWQQRKKLQHLQELADADPKDPVKQAEYLRALNAVSCQAVLERFERREHASDSQTVAEYLKALVATNAISDYLPDDANFKGVSLPYLLQELRQRAAGQTGELGASPGITEQQPLHVVMVEGKSKSVSSRGLRILQEIVGTVLIFILFSVFWVLAATALRRYVAGVTSTAIGGAAPGGGVGTAAGVYAPKEYSKETMPEKSVKTFKDVKGCDEAKAELEEIVEYLKNPTKFTRLGGKLPKGVLLVGPPGTGKTLLAKAIAGEAGVPFFYRAGSEFEEMFVGVGARRVRALFQAAKKKAPCIVFIDEIDAVGASRKQWEGHTKKTLNQLLVEMDGFEANDGIIVIAATNLPEMLDPALTRPGRFDRHVVVANPDIRGRKEILDLYLSDKPRDESVDSTVLARGTPGFSGADLANLVNMAAIKAALEGNEKISISQLEFAKDKILMGSERKSMAVSDECRKNTAYHESGHALVALHTEGAMPIHKATIMPRGMALGMVTQLPDSDYENSRTKQQMLARLDVCMGGRVAEEMIFGAQNVTSGARDDLRQATKVARHMVLECGFSDELGPVFIDPDSAKLSSETLRKTDAEVTKLLREAYDRVKNLLKKREAELHKLAQALMDRETLTASEIREVVGQGTETPELDEPADLIPQLNGDLDKDLIPAAATLRVPSWLRIGGKAGSSVTRGL